MPERLTFDGEVIIVTGGAGGLGKTQCLELARRGARVVVNDLGGSPLGEGSEASPAQAVADEITAAGGEAVASTDSVAAEDGPDRIVASAIDRWGRVDGFVANSAIVRNKLFEDMADADWDELMAVDLRGVFRGLRSVYRAMKVSGGGRIVVMTSTSGIAGAFGQSNYAAAKMGLLGLVRTIAWEGCQYGIRANLVASGTLEDRGSAATLTAEKVTPMVVRLVHRDCPVTGQVYAANAGIYHRFAMAANDPVVIAGQPTPEDLVDRWPGIQGERLPHEVDSEAMFWGLNNYAEQFLQLIGGATNV